MDETQLPEDIKLAEQEAEEQELHAAQAGQASDVPLTNDEPAEGVEDKAMTARRVQATQSKQPPLLDE
jgi:hypothetical protein